MNKAIKFIIILIFLTNCTASKKNNAQNENLLDIFKKKEPIKEELNQELKIKYLNNFKSKPFLKNNSNNNGNIDFEASFKTILKYKFKKIHEFNSNQPELFFTENEEIIFFNGKGTIFKFSDDLKKIWEVNNYNKKEKKQNPILYFAQVNNNLIVNDNLSKMYSINLSNGKVNWSKYSSSSFNSDIKVYKDRFLTLDFDNVIRAISYKDGKELWNFKTENSFVWQTPTQSNLIYQDSFSLENSDLVFENNNIYFSNNKNEFFSIDARNGLIRWIQSVNSSLRPTIIDSLIFTISNEGYLFVIDDRTGNILRITDIFKNIKNKENLEPTGFIHCKYKIYVSLDNGQLIIVNSSTGIQEKITKFHGSKISRPFIFKNSMYLIKDNGIIKIN